MLTEIVIYADEDGGYSAKGWDANGVSAHLTDGETWGECFEKTIEFMQAAGLNTIRVEY